MTGRDDDGTDDKKNEKRVPKKTTVPATRAPKVLAFLETQFHAESDNAVDKLVLVAVYGDLGMRQGPIIREWTFAPHKKPGREDLVELANTVLAVAEEDVDALGRPTKYSLLAYDMARNDRAVGRVLFKLSPTGMRSTLEDERGEAFDDDEGGRLSTKLLLGLLTEERRDKRWMLEQTMNVMSGAAERDAQRIERMEAVVDSAFQKQAAWLEATEKMLSGAADRQAKAAWAAWKQEKLGHAVDKVLGIAEVILPSALKLPANGSPPAAGAGAPPSNPVRDFMNTVELAQGEIAFGKFHGERFGDPSARLTDGIFTDEQFRMLIRLAEAPAIDNALADKFIASVRPDQFARAKEIFSLAQLAPLAQWIAAHHAGANGAQP